MVSATALQLFPFISSVSRGGGEQFLSPVWWWNGTRRAGDHRSRGDWDFGLCAGMGRLGMMPGRAAGAHGAEGALAGAGAVPGPGGEGKGSCGGWEAAAIRGLHEKESL